MFTGLIRNLGRLKDRQELPNDLLLFTFHVPTPTPCFQGQVGASIACNGVCLTAVMWDVNDHGIVFAVQVTQETLSCSALLFWKVGDFINFETSLKAGDPIDGHLVLGHCDGVAEIVDIVPLRERSGDHHLNDEQAFSFLLQPPRSMMRFIAPKGSVALDGVSLTVNAVTDHAFSIALIPHTLRMTTWGHRVCGDRINIEVDVLARYAVRALHAERPYS
jgi:riboflavin synthase